MALLVRTWNLFHGNALPPGRRAYLREMIELVTADDPDVVCLQEVPGWALGRLDAWSGMQALGAIAAPPRIGRRARSSDGGSPSSTTGSSARPSPARGSRSSCAAAAAPRGPPARRHGIAAHSTKPVGPNRVLLGVELEGGIYVGDFHVTGGEVAQEQFARVVDLAEGDTVVLAAT